MKRSVNHAVNSALMLEIWNVTVKYTTPGQLMVALKSKQNTIELRTLKPWLSLKNISENHCTHTLKYALMCHCCQQVIIRSSFFHCMYFIWWCFITCSNIWLWIFHSIHWLNPYFNIVLNVCMLFSFFFHFFVLCCSYLHCSNALHCMLQ